MRPELELDLLCMKKGTAEAVPLVPVLLSVSLWCKTVGRAAVPT